MLEFLGLEGEAMQLLLGCILIGLPLGAQIGALSAYAKQDSDKATPGQIVFTVICVITGIIGLLLGALPAVILFFTFQWKAIIGGLLLGGVAAAVTYAAGRCSVLQLRRRKYMRNPIVVEAANFCQQHNIEGIQCFADGLRFLKKLKHPDYCKTSIHVEKKETSDEADAYRDAWSAPEAWRVHDNASNCVRALRFCDRGYPNVSDLPMFASALAKKLRSFRYATHKHSVQYDTVAYSVNTKTTTHHITVLRDDCFVYSRAAYRRAKEEYRRQKPEQTPEPAVPTPKPNTWE